MAGWRLQSDVAPKIGASGIDTFCDLIDGIDKQDHDRTPAVATDEALASTPYRDREARTWACSIVMSRAFQVRGRMMLLPVIDAFNNATDGCLLESVSTPEPEPEPHRLLPHRNDPIPWGPVRFIAASCILTTVVCVKNSFRNDITPTHHRYNADGMVLLRSRVGYSAGDEIFNSYGDDDGGDKPDAELLANYGYCNDLQPADWQN